MSKNKTKTKKKKSLYKSFKASIPKNKVLYSVLGVVGAGLAVSSALGRSNRQAVAEKLTTTFNSLRKPTATPDTNLQSDQTPILG